jgi:hypothetical protein
MKHLFTSLVLAAVLAMSWVPANAGRAEEFAKIKILDDIMVFVDVDGAGLDSETLRTFAIDAFKKSMRGMEVNNDAVVDNYPAEGYELTDVGYIIIKIMSMHTESGVNVYHLGFEFGVPPRQVYWDTAMMGVARNNLKLGKEVREDIEEVMNAFAKDFYSIREQ